MRLMMFLAVVAALSLQGAMAAEVGEKLILAPYPAATPWKEVTNQSSGNQWLREQIPADQEIDTYRDILTAQSFPQLKGASPSSFLKGMFANVNTVCEGTRVNGPKERVEGGYTVAYAQIYCGVQTGKDYGVNMFYKVIQGNDALYVVQREFHVPPGATGGVIALPSGQMARMVSLIKDQATANRYLLESVYLCGQRASDKRCSAP